MSSRNSPWVPLALRKAILQAVDPERDTPAALLLARSPEMLCECHGIGLRCVNKIPQGYGLGSSAGAIVSGVLAACALGPGGKDLTDADVLRIATQLEGHPDNVSACLAG